MGIEVQDLRTISGHPSYHGWPTLCRRRDGRLLVVASAARQEHTCPFGQIWLMRSDDDGETWSAPRVLVNGPLDERDPGIMETSRGTLLISWFNSIQWVEVLDKLAAGGEHPGLELAAVAHWSKVRLLVEELGPRRHLGIWMMRSTDGGETWSSPYDSVVNSAHGPIELADGRLFHVGMKGIAAAEQPLEGFARGPLLGAAESTDDGVNWRWLGPIAVRPGDRSRHYLEPTAIELVDGRIVVQMRYHSSPEETPELLQMESIDGGRSWSIPRDVGFFGFPAHLLQLADGGLLTTYGHRRPPYGVQARVSRDGGRSWSAALVLSDDGLGRDLGYPTTVQFADGRLLTVWYDRFALDRPAVLRQATWRLTA